VDLIARLGAGAVTHRAVAKEAGVPLASTTYYFESKDDLLSEAFRHLARDEILALERGIDELPKTLSPQLGAAIVASELATALRVKKWRVLAEFEMHVQSARSAGLRETHRRYTDIAARFFSVLMERCGSSSPEADGALVLCVLSGLEIGQLADPRPHFERDIAGPLFARLFGALAPTAD